MVVRVIGHLRLLVLDSRVGYIVRIVARRACVVRIVAHGLWRLSELIDYALEQIGS